MNLTSDQIVAIAGFLLPLLIAVVKRESFPNYVNAIIALVSYAVVAVIATIAQGPFAADAFETNFAIVFGSGTIGYAALWKASLDPVITAKVNGGTPAA